MMVAVRGNMIGAREDLNQNHAGNKATDMGPEGYPARLADRRKAADKLYKHPVKKHRPSRKCDRCNEESQRHQREDADVRIEDKVGSHNPANGPGRADHRNA